MKNLTELTDSELDALSMTQIDALKAARSAPEVRAGAARLMRAGGAGDFAPARRTNGIRLVVEGDSWCDYPLAVDIYDALVELGYEVRGRPKAGDTLENMVWGTKYGRGWERERPQLDETLEIIREHRPRALVWSGGGNDIAGPEFAAVLDHADLCARVGRDPFRVDLADQLIQRFREGYERVIESVLDVQSDLHIFVHGYGNPIPDGRGWRLAGVDWVGPWLRPSLAAKNIPVTEGRKIITGLITRFNDMLAGLQRAHDQFHHVDVRDIITDSDWVNELHVKNSCYRRIGAAFDAAIRGVLGSSGRTGPATFGRPSSAFEAKSVRRSPQNRRAAAAATKAASARASRTKTGAAKRRRR